MQWKILSSEAQLSEIVNNSQYKPQVVFKHSTRCSVSSMAKARLEKNIFPESADFYYLDLIANRNISTKIAEDFKVWHESPQVIVIKNGEAVYDESHSGISWNELMEQV